MGFTLVFLLIAIVPTLFGLADLWASFGLLRRGRRTVGALQGWRSKMTGSSQGHTGLLTFHQPIVGFQAEDGSTHAVTATWGVVRKPPWPLGHPLPVRYDPADPRQAALDTLQELWLRPMLLLAVGGFFLWHLIVNGPPMLPGESPSTPSH